MYDIYIKELNAVIKASDSRYIEDGWPLLEKEELILKSDMAYELGGGDKYGIGGVAFTKDAALCDKSGVVVYGKDLQELNKDSSYARFTIIRLKDDFEFNTARYTDLRRIDYVRFHIYPKGFMMRISTAKDRETIRISQDAIRQGITFNAVGKSLIDQYMEIPDVLAVKVIFITAENADYKLLQKKAKEFESITESMNDILKGMTMDCTSCGYKQICDEVEGLRELHFSRNKASAE